VPLERRVRQHVERERDKRQEGRHRVDFDKEHAESGRRAHGSEASHLPGSEPAGRQGPISRAGHEGVGPTFDQLIERATRRRDERHTDQRARQFRHVPGANASQREADRDGKQHHCRDPRLHEFHVVGETRGDSQPLGRNGFDRDVARNGGTSRHEAPFKPAVSGEIGISIGRGTVRCVEAIRRTRKSRITEVINSSIPTTVWDVRTTVCISVRCTAT